MHRWKRRKKKTSRGWASRLEKLRQIYLFTQWQHCAVAASWPSCVTVAAAAGNHWASHAIVFSIGTMWKAFNVQPQRSHPWISNQMACFDVSCYNSCTPTETLCQFVLLMMRKQKNTKLPLCLLVQLRKIKKLIQWLQKFIKKEPLCSIFNANELIFNETFNLLFI